MACSFGTECCCGVCHPELQCSCTSGQWACFFTDACLGAAFTCPDAGLDSGPNFPPDTGPIATPDTGPPEDSGPFTPPDSGLPNPNACRFQSRVFISSTVNFIGPSNDGGHGAFAVSNRSGAATVSGTGGALEIVFADGERFTVEISPDPVEVPAGLVWVEMWSRRPWWYEAAIAFRTVSSAGGPGELLGGAWSASLGPNLDLHELSPSYIDDRCDAVTTSCGRAISRSLELSDGGVATLIAVQSRGFVRTWEVVNGQSFVWDGRATCTDMPLGWLDGRIRRRTR